MKLKKVLIINFIIIFFLVGIAKIFSSVNFTDCEENYSSETPSSEVYKKGESYVEPNYSSWKYNQNEVIYAPETNNKKLGFGETITKTYDSKYGVEQIEFKFFNETWDSQVIQWYQVYGQDFYGTGSEYMTLETLRIMDDWEDWGESEYKDDVLNYYNPNISYVSSFGIKRNWMGIISEKYGVTPFIQFKCDDDFGELQENKPIVVKDDGKEVVLSERVLDGETKKSTVKITPNTDSQKPDVTNVVTIELNLGQGNGDPYDYNDVDWGWEEVNLTYDILSITNFYSLDSIKFNESQTSNNFKQHLWSKSENPFIKFQEYTYSELEKEIIDNHLIVSNENDIPYEYVDIVFYENATSYGYDENGDEILVGENEITNEDEYVDLNTIYFQLKPKAEFWNEEGDIVFIGESPIMKIEIPYFGFEVKNTGEQNIFEQYGNKNNVGYWEYGSDEKWHYKTNTPIEISGTWDGGINNIEINKKNSPETKISSNINSSNSIQEFLNENETWNKWNNQIEDNSSNNGSYEIKITNVNDSTFEFVYDLEVENKNNIEIGKLENGNESDIVFQDKMMVFDQNNNNEFEGDEIFSVDKVQEYGFSWENKSDEGFYRKYNFNTNIWEQFGDYDEKTEFTEEGLYLLTDYDEYRNVTYEIVDFNSEVNSIKEPLLIPYEESELYKENQEIAAYQGIEDLMKKSIPENWKIDQKIKYGNLVDLSNTVINYVSLEEITNNYQTETEFSEMQTEFENEINSQMSAQGFLPSDYQILWWLNGKPIDSGNNTVYTQDKLSFQIIPSGNWNSMGESEIYEFEAKNWTNLTSFNDDVNRLELAQITNGFEQGTSFGEIKVKLEKEINQTLEASGVDSNALSYQWNLNDNDKVYYNTNISGTISSQTNMYQGVIEIEDFSSSTYYDLNHLSIDTNSLQQISIEHSGQTWGEVEPYLNQEIINQINQQGYSYLTQNEIIGIKWTYDQEQLFEINSDDVIESDSIIYFEIITFNNKIARNNYQGEIKYGFVPNTKEQNTRIYSIIFLSLIILILIFILYVYYRQKKHKKHLKQKIKANNQILEANSLIKELEEE